MLAETFLRLDHLEDALHRVKHEEMINGVLMRLDHLQTEMQYVKDHAEDMHEEKSKQMEFREQVRVYAMLHSITCDLRGCVCHVKMIALTDTHRFTQLSHNCDATGCAGCQICGLKAHVSHGPGRQVAGGH